MDPGLGGTPSLKKKILNRLMRRPPPPPGPLLCVGSDHAAEGH